MQVRWAESVKDLDFKLRGLVGDALVSAGAVAYIGAFTSKYRKDLNDMWVNACYLAKIPISQGYDFVKNMSTANQVSQFRISSVYRHFWGKI